MLKTFPEVKYFKGEKPDEFEKMLINEFGPFVMTGGSGSFPASRLMLGQRVW